MRWQKKDKEEHPHPGRLNALDGLTAAHDVESAASDVVVVESSPAFAALTGGPAANAVRSATQQVADARRAIALASGLTVTGSRAGVFVGSLAGAREELAAAAGKHLPLVVHLIGRTMTRHAMSMNASHDDYHVAADVGCFSLFATNPQQASDFALIARRVAETSLAPGICAQDLYETSHSVQDLLTPTQSFIREYLGAPDDVVDTPTPAQRMVFGPQRHRVPAVLDPDRPVGLGGAQDRESFIKGVAAGQIFFASHLAAMIDDALQDFGRQTGRSYGKISGYRVDDAQFVVVAQGSVVDELRGVVDYLRQTEKRKVGVVGIHVFRPFPGPEIARMLKGKRVVTVLERSGTPLSEDRPILAQARAAIDKALDNGAALQFAPHRKYVSFGIAEKPLMLSGGYGIGGANPTFAELVAVYRNMFSHQGRRTQFFVGADFSPDTSRFPHLETVSQQLNREYPARAEWSLSPVRVQAPPHASESVQIHALSIQGALYAVNLAAQALADMGNHVRTMPEGGLEPTLQPARLTLSFAHEDPAPSARPTEVGSVLVSGEVMLAHLQASAPIERGGTLIVETNRDPATLWRAMPSHLARWIRDHELKLMAIDARRIATETASQPSAIDQLAVWALLGAWVDRCVHRSPLDLSHFIERLSPRIAQTFGENHGLDGEIAQALRRGAEEVVEVQPTIGGGVIETEQVEAPWTVQHIKKGDDTVFDPARFWRSVGYLYDTGQDHSTLTDPLLATGIVPAGSSAFRDLTAYRIRIPSWLAENCTGCGSCWAQCPESALPPTVQPVSALVRTAMGECESRGLSMVQMSRIADHLAKQATRVVTKGGPQPYTSAAALLDVAFAELVERMNLDAKALAAMTSEFNAVRTVVGELPIARTEVFFDRPNANAKDSGTLLSIVLNPLSCTACGICVDVCADDALQWVEQVPAQVAELRRTWTFHHALPQVSSDVLSRHVTAEADSEVNRLLDKHAYHAMVGGDGGLPGNGAKTAVHLITAAVESVMRPRFEAHTARLATLIERLESRIQGEFAGAVEINDFDAFGRRLRNLDRRRITPDDLVDLAGEEKHARTIDGERLRRLSDLLREIKSQRERYQPDASGAGRARMLLAIDTDDGSFWHGTYPYNPHRHPWIRQLAGDAAALSEGVFLGVAKRLAAEFESCRRADLELSDAYEPAEHDGFFAQFDWTAFDDNEMRLVPPVIVIGSPSSTPHGGLSRLLNSDYPIKVAIIDNDGLPISGGQDIDLTQFALAQRRAYVVQSSTGHPGHLMRGVVHAIDRHGPALFHIYASDPHRSGIAPEKGAEQARLACDSRAWPLFEFDGSASREAALQLEGNPHADRVWADIDLPIRGASGESASIAVSLTPADWAVHENRFQDHFRLLSKGRRDDGMKPLSEYLELDSATRAGFEPFINVADKDGRHLVALVGPVMVRATEDASRTWRALQKMVTGDAQHFDKTLGANADKDTPRAASVPAAGEVDPVVYRRVADRLLQLCGYSDDPEFFKQSLRDFVTRDPSAELDN